MSIQTKLLKHLPGFLVGLAILYFFGASAGLKTEYMYFGYILGFGFTFYLLELSHGSSRK